MISTKPWSLEAVARLFLGVIFTLCFGMALAGGLQKMPFGMAPAQLEFVQMVIMVAFFQGAALVWLAIFLRQSNLSWRNAFGLRPTSRMKAIIIGLAVGLFLLPVMWTLQALCEDAMQLLHLNPVAQAAVTELQNAGLSGWEKTLFGVLTIILAPMAEEGLFRGVLYPTIKQMGYPRLALWGTSSLFGIMHFNMEALVPLVVLAVILTFLYEASESLLTPIATHAMFNAANFFYLIFPDAVNRLLHLP